MVQKRFWAFSLNFSAINSRSNLVVYQSVYFSSSSRRNWKNTCGLVGQLFEENIRRFSKVISSGFSALFTWVFTWTFSWPFYCPTPLGSLTKLFALPFITLKVICHLTGLRWLIKAGSCKKTHQFSTTEFQFTSGY